MCPPPTAVTNISSSALLSFLGCCFLATALMPELSAVTSPVGCLARVVSGGSSWCSSPVKWISLRWRQSYFADVLTRLVNLWPASRLDELMPWAWAAERRRTNSRTAAKIKLREPCGRKTAYLQAGQCRKGHEVDPGLPRSQGHTAHGALHGAVTDPV